MSVEATETQNEFIKSLLVESDETVQETEVEVVAEDLSEVEKSAGDVLSEMLGNEDLLAEKAPQESEIAEEENQHEEVAEDLTEHIVEEDTSEVTEFLEAVDEQALAHSEVLGTAKEVAVAVADEVKQAVEYPINLDAPSIQLMRTIGTNETEVAQLLYMLTGRRSKIGYSELSNEAFEETMEVIETVSPQMFQAAFSTTLNRFWRMGETHIVSQFLTEMSFYLEEVSNAKNRDK